ncbi:SH3 domain-containing protein [Pseudoduganella sp. OTU4001]|uniref:SH3 domain-containing protein n=1 Tax=Pseudoduganella sp. OTU4001 TaxID=3043854 RepID=UPI00313CE0D1
MDAYLPIGAYLAALAATLVVACYLTPARWWRRPTLRNLGIVAGGTWAIGAVLLHALGGSGIAVARAAPAAPAAVQAAAPGPALAGTPFRVHRDLNLRQSAGTSAARLATIPAGTLIEATGEHDGDWWQVRAEIDGKPLTGWASSLWLRRQAE